MKIVNIIKMLFIREILKYNFNKGVNFMSKMLQDHQVIEEIMKRIVDDEKKEEIYKYIRETSETCVNLCRAGEPIRVLNEVYFMLTNLRLEFDL